MSPNPPHHGAPTAYDLFFKTKMVGYFFFFFLHSLYFFKNPEPNSQKPSSSLRKGELCPLCLLVFEEVYAILEQNNTKVTLLASNTASCCSLSVTDYTLAPLWFLGSLIDWTVCPLVLIEICFHRNVLFVETKMRKSYFPFLVFSYFASSSAASAPPLLQNLTSVLSINIAVCHKSWLPWHFFNMLLILAKLFSLALV